MLFNSYVFLLGFLPLVLAGWWGLRPDALRLGFLTLASWVFYAWWDWRFLPLLVLSTSVDWVAARLIDGSEDGRRRRAVLVAALGINLGILGFFKYAGFFLASLDGLGRLVGADPHLPSLDIVLPIGISFYTFNSLSYTIDVYRRVVRPADSVLQYTAFVALFPHLIAGPIVRFADLHEQLRRPARRLTGELAWAGLVFLVCGLVKKVVIADGLAGDVDLLFAVHGSLGMAGAWAAALGYSLQLYFDFSGYSDMAVGLALLLGFHFPQNFDSPYKSASIAEFWRRWHMSLSFWLRDYLFIPLGGSRGSRLETLRNLVVVMALGGLWHGAAWTFVVWGLVHGALLVIHALARGAGVRLPGAFTGRALTFACVVAAFVVFRAPSLGVAGDVLGAMAGGSGHLGGMGLVRPGFALAVVALVAFVQLAPNTWELDLTPSVRKALLVGAGGAIAFAALGAPSPFLYFQF